MRTNVSVGAEEDGAGPDGAPVESRLHPACHHLHQGLLAETGHRHLSHPILCHRGKSPHSGLLVRGSIADGRISSRSLNVSSITYERLIWPPHVLGE